MFIQNWKKELCTVPNLLSLTRLTLLPLYCSIYLHARTRSQYLLAGGIMALSCLTDLADGKLARRLGQITNLGKVLDPLADKVTQFTLILCLSLKMPALQPVLGVFVVKELFQLAAGLLFLTKGRMLPGALTAGKVCTTALFISLTGLVILPDVHPAVVEAVAIGDSVFLINAFVCYILAYFGRETKVQDI